jgi:hypothetical protein
MISPSTGIGKSDCYIEKLHPGLLSEVLTASASYLEWEDLASTATVCRIWNECIESEDLWETQCRTLFGLSPENDPKVYAPNAPSYKAIFKAVSFAILGPRVYEHCIGPVGVVSRYPKGSSLQKWNEPDPCDPTRTIGENYVWMYIPSYIETNSEDVVLNPNNPGALQFCRRKVPVTIENIKKLFEQPKTGYPVTYKLTCQIFLDAIVKQHGNSRWPAGWASMRKKGWVCMRKNVIGRKLIFAEQEALARKSGVEIPEFLPRFLFNCLGHVRSGTDNIYPDGMDPRSNARTSTLTRDLDGTYRPTACGDGSCFGLLVSTSIFRGPHIGVAVVLPEVVQDECIESEDEW